MYYLFLGDRQKAYKKASEVANILSNKSVGINLIKVGVSDYDDSKIAEHLNSQALFSTKNVILISGLIGGEVGEFMLENLKAIKESNNIFIIVDQTEDKKILEKLEKHAEKVQKFDEKIQKKERDNSIFVLADYFGRRDKKNLWKEYQILLMNHGAGEILNIVLWQTKAIISAMLSASGAEAGLAPYVYTKSKTFAKNFSNKEILDLMLALTKINLESFYSDEYISPKLEKLFLEY